MFSPNRQNNQLISFIEHIFISRSLRTTALIGALATTGLGIAAELTIGDGVVVKFGQDAQIVVHDKLSSGKGVVLTSQKDDTIGGQVGVAPAVPAVSDWKGVRVEKSASSFGFALEDLTLRYSGSGNEAGLLVRGFNPSLKFLQITDSVVGLRLQGASPTVTGSSFTRNVTGIEVENSQSVFSNTQIAGNTTQGILNKSPSSIVQATGNWWGHASGPRDAVNNPNGQGDVVSIGVNYGNYLNASPLLNPSIRLTAPATYYETRAHNFEISCINATEYRIAENGAFAGVGFQALPNGRASIDYTLSAGDGRKTVDVQFRNASGTIVSSNLAGGVLIDTQAPTLTITNPSPGSLITQPITLEASASDASGIARVDIFLDGQLAISRTGVPYNYAWDTSTSTDGAHEFRVVAYDQIGRQTQQSVNVTLSRVVQAPDVEGPELSGFQLGGMVLQDGLIVTRSGALSLQASDRSGISKIEVLLDGQVIGIAAGNGTYSLNLDLSAVGNGSHTLGIRATDSLSNVRTQTFAITVAHAAPNAPALTQPNNGLVTRTAAQTIVGSAAANNTIQLVNNGQAFGSPLAAGSDGKFSTVITLNAGENRLQATASDAYGTSLPSAILSLTLDSSVPAAPTNLLASALAQGKIRLVWNKPADPNIVGFDLYRSASSFATLAEAIKINGSRITGTNYEDMPATDGTWYYRVVSVNAVSTNSDVSNLGQAVADNTLPKALNVTYVPQGKYDAVSGRFGQGRVNVTLNVSEALQTAPYLAIVPVGGAPLVVDLIKNNDTTYTGSFTIDGNTASGVASVIFSARDLVGNRGTDVQAGGSLKIDTEGPVLTGIQTLPGAPIKNDPAKTLALTFTLSKALKSGATPQINGLLSGPLRQAQAVTGLAAQNATTWTGSFALPSDAGLGGPETLGFTFSGQDDLDNTGNRITALNRFQVYQGNLPPVDIPAALTAKALPGGKVRLDWQAVGDASAYQIYRQAPGENQLQALARIGTLTYTDQTTVDGRYQYAIASVRQSNGQETLSGQSAPVEVQASATAPGAPQNLSLRLTGQGIVAEWQAPVASIVSSYNLYRAVGTSITSTTGLVPYKSGIKQTIALDAIPSATQGAYVVTAQDAAGNESALSNSAYLNASLLPVTNLNVTQIGAALPVISWNAPNGNVAGYLVYLGPDNNRIKLTPAPSSALNYTDTGYTTGERRYTIATVDTQSVEMPRSILMPAVSAQVVGGLPIKRGLMNKLQVQVTNTSNSPLDNLKVVVRLPIDRNATQFQDHRSTAMSLGANQSLLVPVVVGGYADLPGQALAQVGVEIAPNEGELVKLAKEQMLDVIDSTLVVGMATEDFTRGATGKLRLTIENTSDVDLELLTAINNGQNESSELRFKLLDADNNVLSTQAFKQAVGANVITLTNGSTVARIAAGASYLSDLITLNVPAASPNNLRVRLEVDKIRYHSGQEDQVIITGRGSEKTVNLADTAYLGEVTDVTPINSLGDQDIVITGRALERSSRNPLPSTRLKLILNQQGFERAFDVLTDAAGNFVYSFKPTLADAGLYKVAAIHPDMTDRPEQKSFTIQRITVGPTPYRLDVSRNYNFAIPFVAKAGVGTAASNLRLVLDGVVPTGITLQASAPVMLAERQTLNIPLSFVADNAAAASGTLNFNLLADEYGATPIGQVRVNYTLSEAKPYLTASPSYVETGLAQGGSQLESVLVENKGLQDALNLRFSLTEADGVTAAPNWASIASQVDGTLAVGQKRAVDLSFTPPANLAEGVYSFKLKVQGDNVPAQLLNVFVSVTQSGQGNVLFKASDIYTATLDKQGRLILGLAGATVTIQNEDVASVSRELVTDAQGEAYVQDLPAGRYKYRVRATNHQETGGRLQVKPGVTLNQPLFLDYNLIQVEWSVKEITIQDRYEITLNATYETDVPAAVVVHTPRSVNLPKMNAGDVFYGEINIQNFGLVRADNLKIKLPPDDVFYKFEFLVNLPSALEAKQKITVPYRITSLKVLDDQGAASGGGCATWSATLPSTCSYVCANGQLTETCGDSTSWFASSSCVGGGTNNGIGGTAGGTGGGSSSSWGAWSSGGGGSYQSMPGVPPCTKCDGKCCNSGGDGGK